MLSPIGTEVTYELTKTSNESNNITKIKKVEPIGQVGVTGNGNIKSNYNDPSVVKRIAFSMCQTISRMFFTYTGRKPRDLEDINGLAGIFYNWVLSGIVQDNPHFRDQVSRCYYSLQLAVECMVFTNLGIASKEQVMDAAEVFLGPLIIFTDEPPF